MKQIIIFTALILSSSAFAQTNRLSFIKNEELRDSVLQYCAFRKNNSNNKVNHFWLGIKLQKEHDAIIEIHRLFHTPTNEKCYIYKDSSNVFMVACRPENANYNNIIDTTLLFKYDNTLYPEKLFKHDKESKSWRLLNEKVYLRDEGNHNPVYSPLLQEKSGIIYYEKEAESCITRFFVFKACNIFEYWSAAHEFTIGTWYIKENKIYLFDHKKVNLDFWTIADYPKMDLPFLSRILEIHEGFIQDITPVRNINNENKPDNTIYSPE